MSTPILESARDRPQDPLSSPAYSQLGYAYRGTDRLDEAVEAYRRSLELAPQRITAHHVIEIMLADRGRNAEALAEANLEPSEWARLTALVYVHHPAGRKGESDAALAQLEAGFGVDSAIQIAAVHATRAERGRFPTVSVGYTPPCALFPPRATE